MLRCTGTVNSCSFLFLFPFYPLKQNFFPCNRRFQMNSAAQDGSAVPMSQSMMVETFIPPYQLTPPMDIFAAGWGSFHEKIYCIDSQAFIFQCLKKKFNRCSLIELFTEGQAPFDFAQLLSYRSQEMANSPVIEKMEDSAVRVNILDIN